MELRHLRYFAAVADTLHFGRAAARLGIQQPPLSIQIRQLESEIGTLLLQRTGRRVSLTDAGLAFARDAAEIIQSTDRAVDRARRVARGEAGLLRVGMINSAPFHPLIPTILREYRQTHPQVSIDIQESTTPELATRVTANTLDVAFVRPLLGPHSGLVEEPLFDEPVVVALPSGHPLTKQRTVALGALSLLPFVLFPRSVGAGLYDDIISACRRAGFSPRVAQEASQVTSIVNLVGAGLGVSLVPASMQKIHSMGVAYRPLRRGAPSARMSLVFRRGEEGPAVLTLCTLARSVAKALR